MTRLPLASLGAGSRAQVDAWAEAGDVHGPVHAWLLALCGDFADAAAVLAAAAGRDPKLYGELVRLCDAVGWEASALRAAQAWMAVQPDHPQPRQKIAQLLARRGLAEPWPADPLQRALAVGDWQAAENLGHGLPLARWRGQTELAGKLAAAALQTNAGDAEAWLTLGVLAAHTGDDAAALGHLDRTLAADPRQFEALCWRAELHLRRGDLPACHRDLDAAAIAAPGFCLPAAILRLLASDDGANMGRLDAVAAAFAQMWPQRYAKAQTMQQTWQLAQNDLRPALQRLGLNRGRYLTLDTGAALRRFDPPPSPRHRSRQILESAHVLPPSEVTAALQDHAETAPHSPLPLAYAGEWQLWLGQLDAAEKLLQRALDRWQFTRWPHAGLATVALLRGQFAPAVRWLDLGRQRMGGEGPPWLVARGEIAWRQGRSQQAIEFLSAAVQRQNRRAAAWVVLGLADPARADTCAGWLQDAVPALWSDARKLAQAGDPQRQPSSAQLLQAALGLLRGCRASSLSVYAPPWLGPDQVHAVRAEPGRWAAVRQAALGRVAGLVGL